MNYAERERKVIANFRALYLKRKRVSVRTEVKVNLLPGRVLVKVRVKDKKETRELMINTNPINAAMKIYGSLIG